MRAEKGDDEDNGDDEDDDDDDDDELPKNDDDEDDDDGDDDNLSSCFLLQLSSDLFSDWLNFPSLLLQNKQPNLVCVMNVSFIDLTSLEDKILKFFEF